MSGINRVIKSEFRHAFHSKVFLPLLLSLFFVFLILITVFFAYNTSCEYRPLTEEVKTFYSGEIKANKELYEFYSSKGGDADKELTAYHYERYKYFSFLLENNAVAQDYYPYDALLGSGTRDYKYVETDVAFNVFTIFALVCIVLGTGVAVYVCITPYKKGIVNNYLAAPIKKQEIYIGKMLFCYILYAAMCLILFIWGTGLISCNGPSYAMAFNGTEYAAVSCLEFYSVQVIGLFLLLCLNNAVLCLAGTVFKKIFPTVCVTAALYIIPIALLLCFWNGEVSEIALKSTPFFNLTNTFYSFDEWQPWVMWLVYAALIVLFALLSAARTNKKSQEGFYEN